MREDELLAALLRELSGPISAVYYDLERMRVNVHRFIRRRRVFDVVCAVLSGEPGSLPPLPVTLQGPVVVVEVADTGKGIPASLRPQLFELGAQARPGGGGAGVGLWLSRLVVRAHGGELWLADSARGALFVSVWPMAPAPERPVPMEQASTFSAPPARRLAERASRVWQGRARSTRRGPADP